VLRKGDLFPIPSMTSPGMLMVVVDQLSSISIVSLRRAFSANVLNHGSSPPI